MVEIKNEVHSFIASDRFHGESDQIYEMLRKLDARMREEGYDPDLQTQEIQF